MLRKVCSTSHPLIIYNPSGVFDPDYFKHCAEAGALPVFDTEFFSDDDVSRHIDELDKRGFLFGVRIAADRIDLINRLSSNPVPNCSKTVIYYNRLDDLVQFRPANSGYPVIIEVTDIDINETLERLAPEALILKGLEAQGKVSSYTSFVLLQWYAEKSGYPFFVHGGAGYFTAPGMFAAGASGIVLDSQLYLADECPVSDQIRTLLSNLEESDSTVLSDSSGTRRRFFSKLGTKIVKDLKLKEESGFYSDKDIFLYDEITSHYSPVDNIKDNPAQKLFYLGQDAVFAKYFIKKSSKISEIISDLFSHIGHAISMIDTHDPVVENSLLARDHGTRYPIVQGPMANISDNAGFAAKIYENGALPFMAVGSLPSDIAENMLTSVKKELPQFGAGMIGVYAFNKYLAEHMEIVKKNKVPFALFAAGNPSLIKELEAEGTKAYLHTPSMPMLTNAITAGCRRFIFEGTEAGGHVGNLSSMVLWELALETVNSLPDSTVNELRLLFAGGIGTSVASHFVSGMASSTAGKGCGIGVQVSTSYLFTSEIVGTGALGKLYQEVICREKGTLVIGDTVGLLARTVASPFSKRIHENEIKRVTENIPLHDRKELFEHDNTGSLLIGAKAFHLDFSDPVNVKRIPSDEKEQYEKGNFMAGDIIACNDKQITIKDVHDTIVNRKEKMFRTLNELELHFGENSSIRDEIAIIGMGCIYPDAAGPEEFWNNIVSKQYSISEMPETRLKPFYYNSDKKAEDKTYTKIAGIVKDYRFDYEHFGYSGAEADRLSRSLKMILDAADQAVADAGYNGAEKKLPFERTAVIVATCLTNELNSDLQLKYYYPEILSRLEKVEEFISLGENEKQIMRDRLKDALAQGHHGESADCASIERDASGVASFFGIEGLNYTIDAACASSMAALDAGRRELLSGSHDMVIVGGVNTNLSVESFVGFCKMGALSAEGSFPFDERAGGFVLGEGAGVVVIKRMKDALRDGDKIHAVLKGIGSSSDGKGKAIAAPNPEGQEIALRRCYENIFTGTGADDIGYIEAHGTSTLMGDYAELETLKKFFADNPSQIGLSSVKSQIGHLLGGAGLAGIIKAVQAVKHKVLPSNGQYRELSSRFNLDGTPLYIIKDAAPWEVKNGKARAAAVSSFGFGGINYHCVIGEMTDSYSAVQRGGLFKSDLSDRRIVIAGMGVILPGISGKDELKESLCTGRNNLTDIPMSRFSNDYYINEKDESYSLPRLKAGVLDDSLIDSRKYRMPPATLRSVDRCQFIGLECTKQVLDQSKQNENIQKGNNTAIIVGTANGEKMIENVIRTRLPLIEKIIGEVSLSDKNKSAEISTGLLKSLKERYHINNEDTVPGLLSNVVSGRIANFFGFNGANFIINAGDASSAAAIRLAYLGLKSGEYENVITGGVDSNLTPASFIALKQRGLTGSVTDDGRKTDQDGVSLSEGGALFMLTTYGNAVEKGMPVLAVLDDSVFKTGSDSFVPDISEKSADTGYIINFKTGNVSDGSVAGEGYYRSAEAAVSLAGQVVVSDDRVNKSRIVPAQVRTVSEKLPAVSKAAGEFKSNGLYTLLDGSMTTLLLSGQGAQRSGMMKELYSSNKIVRETLDNGEAVFRNEKGYSLLDLMFGDDVAINSTENTQSAVFLSSAAVFNVLSANGFNPRYYIGHSLGECTALYCSGMLGFDDTMMLVLKRSSLMKESTEKTPGEILALFKGWEESSEHMKRSGVKDVYLANRNSDAQTVIAGSPEGIAEFIGYMKVEKLIYKKLPLSGAFHTPLFTSASDGLRDYLAEVKFRDTDYTKIISNVAAMPYPQDENAVKDLLAKQVISPVQFTESVKYACGSAPYFIEAGPSGILTGLLKNINCGIKMAIASVDHKKGEALSLDDTVKLIHHEKNIDKETQMTGIKSSESSAGSVSAAGRSSSFNINPVSRDDAGFREYIESHRDDMERIMYDEYRRYSITREIENRDSFGFYTGSIVISGVSIGLPGKSRDVFSDDNFECILKGENRIELLSGEDLNRQLDKNITRVKKNSNGNAVLQELKTGDDVVQLAGQLGHFNKLDYGIEFENDKSDALAMAAGIEALRDAGIPLVPQRRKTSTGSYLFNGYALPEEMQETTGIIRSTIFPGFDSIIDEVARYTTAKNINGPYRLFEKIYYNIMETVQNEEIKKQITEWFFSMKKDGAEGDYSFNRNLLLKLGFMGAPQFAQMIQAKGPNTQINAACASMTQGISMAEDWLRAGRCERVIVIGSEAVEPENLGQWLYSGFLAMGAATVEKNVFNAAKPFDNHRNGTIIGSGAAAVIVERADAVQRRGRAGQAEILGTVTGNSAFHGTRIDVTHIADVMGKMIDRAEKRHGLVKDDYTGSMIFMSHETFTPAIGGSAQAEINAIRGAYPKHYRNIVISNTKGYTGHTLGGGLEDPVMIKALQAGMAPSIANLNEVPQEFSDLKFSRGERGRFNYGLHFAAGFGSHYALLFTRRIEETSAENPAYMEWLKKVSGDDKPELSMINRTLCIKAKENMESVRVQPVPVKEEVIITAQVFIPQPQVAESAPVQAAESRIEAVDISSVKDGIKGVIAEQTGYTSDMLDDGLDLEADLGIDTVKQVEIFGKISALYSLDVPEDLKLSDMNTIEKLVLYIASKISSVQNTVSQMTAQAGVKPETNSANGIHRFTISVKVLDAVISDNRNFSGKTFLISRDKSGYTEKISERIKKHGGTVFTLGSGNADCITDMTDPADVEQKVSAFAAEHGEINSFIHLSPIDYIISGKDRTPECIESSVKSLFVIIKTMNEMLRRKGSIIAALSFNSVVFPYCENPGKISPVSGAIAGMLKTVNKEFGDTVVKAVDFSTVHPEKVTDETADLFIKELLSGDTRVEAGYRGSERYGLTLNDKPAVKGESLVRDGSTLLVTGGAGGITFEILKRLAGDYRNLKLIIFDRLDIDSIKKEFLPKAVDESFIISVLKKKMQDAKPLEIKNAAAQIMRTKKAYSNMSVLKSMGVRVDYHAVDVNSSDAVIKALKKYKRIDGIIHAAGMEESQIIEKMTLDSFNRVFNVKGYGVLNLISALSRIEYDFFAAFSSVAARFGNEGQANYSSANEMLAKALFSEKASHKNRIYKICDWTAWEGAGMATNETVNKVLKERGMTFLPLEQGIDLFMKELRDEDAVESIFTGMDLSFDKDGILPGNVPAAETSLPVEEYAAPFLDKIIKSETGQRIFTRTIDMKRDLFMGDHTKDGIPLFLGATGIEAMAEAARSIAGEGSVLSELRDFSIPYSIKILKGRPKELMIEAAEDKNSPQGIVSRITSQFKNPGGVVIGEPTLHYEGRYFFAGAAEQPLISIPKANRIEGDADFQKTIYHPQRLFMDGVFRTVQGIHSFDGELLVTKMKHAPKREFFSGVTDPSFIVDVVLIDAMFQTGGIFEMLTTSDIILPSKINRMVFHRTPERNRDYLCFTRKIATNEESTTFTLILADNDGRVYMEIDRFDMVKITRVPMDERIDTKFRIAG